MQRLKRLFAIDFRTGDGLERVVDGIVEKVPGAGALFDRRRWPAARGGGICQAGAFGLA
jgi:hypothetical protein